MKTFTRSIVFSVFVVIMIVTGTRTGRCQISPGDLAPNFSLEDLSGQVRDLSQMRERPMIILYFFDVDSRPSQEGLLSLDKLAQEYKRTDLTVWAITRSSKAKVVDFTTGTSLTFPVLLDSAGVSDLYEARFILPTVCIIGPGLKVLDYFQGGGKTTQVMLVRLAERELQRKQPVLAKAISEEVIKKNPDDMKAKTVRGYAALKQGNIKEAEAVFEDLSRQGGQAEVVAKEGLAKVSATKGEPEKALKLAEEVEQKAPDRAYPHVIKGDILYARGKKEAAEAEYRQSIQKTEAEPYHKAVRYNQLGRLYASAMQYDRAREIFDQAIAIDPYYVEATTNKGITYEKEGKWDKALESYRQALAVEKSDTFAAVLAKKAQEMVEIQRDAERKKRIDKLVKDLADRYRSQKKISLKRRDTWTSRPMILSFVDFQEKGGLAERDGFSTVLTVQLADHLNASGRVQVVERVLIERLLEELNLGSSELADPETALRLGEVLAAKLIGTGSLYYLSSGTLLSLRLIDTETSAIPGMVNRQFSSHASLEKELFGLNREILKTVISKYPLRGYVVTVSEDRVIINLGSKQGVVLGTKFEVLEEQKPVKYKGKLLQVAPKPVAEIEVVQLEPDLCYGKLLKQERSLKRDDKVQEKMEEATTM
jgi:tetratricopeptide (TPR) repeat protein/peroxiredoxin